MGHGALSQSSQPSQGMVDALPSTETQPESLAAATLASPAARTARQLTNAYRARRRCMPQIWRQTAVLPMTAVSHRSDALMVPPSRMNYEAGVRLCNPLWRFAFTAAVIVGSAPVAAHGPDHGMGGGTPGEPTK